MGWFKKGKPRMHNVFTDKGVPAGRLNPVVLDMALDVPGALRFDRATNRYVTVTAFNVGDPDTLKIILGVGYTIDAELTA